jgi:hypothetical protein
MKSTKLNQLQTSTVTPDYSSGTTHQVATCDYTSISCTNHINTIQIPDQK